MYVILLGPPGVGKGTQAVRLAEELYAAHVSTGDLLRAARREGTALGKQAQDFMDAGELVPDDLILGLVRDHLSGIGSETTVLFDGFPRTTAQAAGLGEVLTEVGRQVDIVVLFEAPDDTLIKRLGGRRSCPDCGAVFNVFYNPPGAEDTCDRCGESLVHRADDTPETVSRRLEVYREQTAPLVSYYEADGAALERVQADRSVDEVYADFRSVVGEAK